MAWLAVNSTVAKHLNMKIGKASAYLLIMPGAFYLTRVFGDSSALKGYE